MPANFILIERNGTERPIHVAEDTSLMNVIRDSGVPDFGLCGGSCACASCHVYIQGAEAAKLIPISEDEDALLGALSKRLASSRLSCQLTMMSIPDGCRIEIAPEDE